MGNTCDCPKPPGGRIECGPTQLAICRVKDGEIRAECIDRPTSPGPSGLVWYNVDSSIVRDNWALGLITGIQRTPFQELTPADKLLLATGKYTDTLTGEIVTFSLPWDKEGESEGFVYHER